MGHMPTILKYVESCGTTTTFDNIFRMLNRTILVTVAMDTQQRTPERRQHFIKISAAESF